MMAEASSILAAFLSFSNMSETETPHTMKCNHFNNQNFPGLLFQKELVKTLTLTSVYCFASDTIK